jgi:hypothetical protein
MDSQQRQKIKNFNLSATWNENCVFDLSAFYSFQDMDKIK